MAHRREHLCSASQLWLPHPALCVVPPECFWGLRVWSGAVGSKSGKLQNIADHDNCPQFYLPSPHACHPQLCAVCVQYVDDIFPSNQHPICCSMSPALPSSCPTP